ncbi:MAG: hypothetical protein IPJ55_13865 [Chloracidobacterium sp.]|nr:hypothetical protein [Chloracidobacterium sp.]
MKIYQSIFNRGKKGGDTGRIENTWTLRLTHVDERENRIARRGNMRPSKTPKTILRAGRRS